LPQGRTVSIASPIWLVTLLVPALALAAYLWIEKRRRPGRYAVSFPNLAVLAGVARGRRQWRRHLTAALLVASIALLCVGVARPHVTLMVPSEQATVIVTLDVSGSMQAEDIKPTRLDAAKSAVQRFLERVPDQVRVGLILFSSETYVAAPPTRDRDAVRAAIDLALPQFGTAIGDAVARSAELASEVMEHPEAVGSESGAPSGDGLAAAEPLAAIVFLSDGFQTRGLLTPEEGARRAVEARVPVHTIALGTDAGVIETERYGEQRIIPVPPDRPTLKAIAETTGGSSYEVRDAERLIDVYDSLGSSIARVEEEREVTAAFVGAGAILLGAAGLFAGLWAPRLP
jgi:Ca-activated chloride channel family protein